MLTHLTDVKHILVSPPFLQGRGEKEQEMQQKERMEGFDWLHFSSQ